MTLSVTYTGLDKEVNGGMTAIGKLIRDAWVFGILPENEMCTGWNLTGIDALQQKVNREWDKYGCLASGLPEDLFERHQDIHGLALQKAKKAGWSGELELEGEL